MGLARPALARTEGLRFWRLMGSGRGAGFSIRPNWSRYALLGVWDSADAADAFFGDSALMSAYRRNAEETWTVRLLPIGAHGSWSGGNPFTPYASAPSKDRPLAVLTRATIRPSRLASFWLAVPSASRDIERAEGLVASIGVGEAPLVRQATFSLWRSEEAMRAFAYKTEAHREAIRRTRDERWYAEELFARFAPVASEGSWDGGDPLEGLL
jgi:heme-degrading monooxygenase HmoA